MIVFLLEKFISFFRLNLEKNQLYTGIRPRRMYLDRYMNLILSGLKNIKTDIKRTEVKLYKSDFQVDYNEVYRISDTLAHDTGIIDKINHNNSMKNINLTLFKEDEVLDDNLFIPGEIDRENKVLQEQDKDYAIVRRKYYHGVLTHQTLVTLILLSLSKFSFEEIKKIIKEANYPAVFFDQREIFDFDSHKIELPLYSKWYKILFKDFSVNDSNNSVNPNINDNANVNANVNSDNPNKEKKETITVESLVKLCLDVRFSNDKLINQWYKELLLNCLDEVDSKWGFGDISVSRIFKVFSPLLKHTSKLYHVVYPDIEIKNKNSENKKLSNEEEEKHYFSKALREVNKIGTYEYYKISAYHNSFMELKNKRLIGNKRNKLKNL